MLLLFISSAWATWTVIGVDPETGEVGAAGATCGPMVWEVAGLSPGHGAVVSQYATTLKGRNLAVDRLDAGEHPNAILEELTTTFDDAHLPERQYGIVSLDADSAGFTGSEVEDEHAERGDAALRAQGNTLRTTDVVDDAYLAMVDAEGEPLAERLMRGLEAGRDDGGDARCPEDAPAQSAFLHVATLDDPKAVSLEVEPLLGGDPVAALRERFDDDQTGCATAGHGGALRGLLGLVAGLLVAGRRRP